MAYESTTGSSQTVTAFFDSRTEAQNAIDSLRSEGLPTAEVRLIEGRDNAGGHVSEHKGFWESLGDLFLPDDDRGTYAEGLARGGYVVSVQTTAENRETVLDILDDEGTVNIDEREASWRSEGWSGYRGEDRVGATSLGDDAGLRSGIAGIGGTTGYAAGAAAGVSRSDATLDRTDVAGTRAYGSDLGAGARDLGEDGKIDVVEEQFRVGKRDVSHGRVRVRSYVVEEPVSESVYLRSEHVGIERRPVDRPVAGTEAVFGDRTIELEETAEEAVISKEARVKEEITLNRDVRDRTETVSDTVRRTEVEIDDERTLAERERGLTGTTGRSERDL